MEVFSAADYMMRPMSGRVHSRRRSNVFGDTRFWFCPNLDQILITFRPNFSKFAQSNKIWPNLNHFSPKFFKICPNFEKFVAAFPDPKALRGCLQHRHNASHGV